MNCLVFFSILLGLVMSVPLHFPDSSLERDAIKDSLQDDDAAKSPPLPPMKRDPALKVPLAPTQRRRLLPRAKNSQGRDTVGRENQMTGERRGYGYGYGGYRGGYGGNAGNAGNSGKSGYGYGGYRGGYGGYGGNSGSSGKAGKAGNSGSAGNAGYGYGGYRGGYGGYGYGKRS